MLNVVRQARRRIFNNELLAQGANAMSAAVLTLILLLVLGTQFLDWRWTVLVPAAAGCIGFYRARRRRPTEYGAAQVVDQRLELADILSTAVYFTQEDALPADADVRELQRERAGKVSETVDLRRAIPYVMPRTAYLFGVLLLVAGSLFALRYGFSRTLDLKPPLASMLPFHLGSQEKANEAQNSRRQPPKPGDPVDDGEELTDPGKSPAGDPDGSDNPDSQGDAQSEQASAAKGEPKQGDKGSKSSEGSQEAQAEQNSESQESNQSQQSNGQQDQKQGSNGKQDQGSNGDNSSLMNKMKDMFQNLLSSVKPPQNNQNNQQQNSDNKQQGKNQQNGGKQPQQGKNGEQQNNNGQGDSQDSQPGDQAQPSQDPQGKGTGKSDSQQASKQPGSGIGNQNGDKSIKQAEDLAAMGKLTELYGKRSSNLTGEATVEVQATSQQLRTPYAQKAAQHAQDGTQIHRDEIPLGIEAYVQQYFEQVRKQAPAPKK